MLYTHLCSDKMLGTKNSPNHRPTILQKFQSTCSKQMCHRISEKNNPYSKNLKNFLANQRAVKDICVFTEHESWEIGDQ